MRVFNNITELVGNTPIVKLNKLGLGMGANLFAKLEYFNPSLSVKDRAALNMIIAAEKEEKIKEGDTIIEATSGNTGIALATIAASRGYKLILVIPDTMSIDKINYVKALGAEVVLTPGVFGMTKAFQVASELIEKTPNSFMPHQITNQNNVLAHVQTAREIINDMDGQIDYFIAGSGTGGTITGVGKTLKEYNPEIKIICVEPLGSAILSGGRKGPHKIQGVGPGFIPEILDKSVIDEIIAISDNDSIEYARKLANQEGIFAGFSAGAAIAATMMIAKRNHNNTINIVTLIADNGSRYLNTELYNKEYKDIFVC
jgi:cysteine synthase A